MNACGYERRLPDVLGIGVKKSGTTMFTKLLRHHPQISTPSSEVHFFDWNYEKGLEYYKSKMGFCFSGQGIFREKHLDTLERKMLRAILLKTSQNSKRIKFILLVKDPIKRSISEFRHNAERLKVIKRLDKPTDYTEGIRFDREVILPNGEVNQVSEPVDTSIYSKYFQNWLQYFHREQFLIIDYDKLVQNVSFILQKVEKFIGLRAFFQDDMFQLTDEKKLCFVPLKSKKVCSAGNNRYIPKAKPSKKTLEKLCDFFRPFNERFMRLANMTFNWNCP